MERLKLFTVLKYPKKERTKRILSSTLAEIWGTMPNNVGMLVRGTSYDALCDQLPPKVRSMCHGVERDTRRLKNRGKIPHFETMVSPEINKLTLMPIEGI